MRGKAPLPGCLRKTLLAAACFAKAAAQLHLLSESSSPLTLSYAVI